MLKKIKPILIVAGEPNSIFFEILFKSLRTKKFKSPIVLIASHKILKVQMKKFNFKKKINIIDVQLLNELKLNNKYINLININFNKKDTHIYLKNCFDIAFKILKLKITNKFINGPINKSTFLNKKFLGITEYISYNFKREKVAMLIYNEKLSVCPLTTHLPIKIVPKKINAKLIKEKVYLIDSFFKENRNFKPKIAVTGLNPHCESILNFNEDQKIITPAIKKLKKEGYNVYGPFPADTIFLKQNRDNYDVILGMYHDQVLAPIKTIKEYNAINITLGLPFFRISPDHGPNLKMINKNISTPLSLIKSIKFLDQK
tara:strand:- start:2691 stop:3638 length:948 start_codon:yes stop_codon:yes gene_type:complete